ncbi:hypothetical protein SDC9_184673 [bioreactor metagenome]|uniref:Uncharacterized protein n=1 Tax=bioreactor metagenome TaxID=1076179 RepID=A0A645HDP7_9ZZZZ
MADHLALGILEDQSDRTVAPRSRAAHVGPVDPDHAPRDGEQTLDAGQQTAFARPVAAGDDSELTRTHHQRHIAQDGGAVIPAGVQAGYFKGVHRFPHPVEAGRTASGR